jgi:hypothetical protein
MMNARLLLGMLLSMAMCGRAGLVKENGAQQYAYNQELPMDVGHYWVYQVTRYDGYDSTESSR